ncbi:MAG: tetratricopeptide repeat protein, partial [Myxococcota bacterium]
LALAEAVANEAALVRSLVGLANVLSERSEYEEALTHSRRASEVADAAFPEGDPNRASGRILAGGAARALGRPEEALAAFTEARDLLRDAGHGSHPNLAYAEVGFAQALLDLDRAAEALPILVRTAEGLEPSADLFVAVHVATAAAHAALDQPARADDALARAERAATDEAASARLEAERSHYAALSKR